MASWATGAAHFVDDPREELRQSLRAVGAQLKEVWNEGQ
jgi:hypothetical protein